MRILSTDDVRKLIVHHAPVVVLDVLGTDSYAAHHLPAALHMPIERMTVDAQRIIPDKTTTVVVYCANAECSASTNAAQHLIDLGYTDVYDYKAGLAEWMRAGLQVEQGVKLVQQRTDTAATS